MAPILFVTAACPHGAASTERPGEALANAATATTIRPAKALLIGGIVLLTDVA
jgi:hypothetical protein